MQTSHTRKSHCRTPKNIRWTVPSKAPEPSWEACSRRSRHCDATVSWCSWCNAAQLPLRKESPPRGTAPLAPPALPVVRRLPRIRLAARPGPVARRPAPFRRRPAPIRRHQRPTGERVGSKGAQGCAGAQGGGGGRGKGEGRGARGDAGGWLQACESMKVEQARLSVSMSAESPRLAFWASEMAYSSCFSDGAPAGRKPATWHAAPRLPWHAACSLRLGGSRGPEALV